MYFCESWPETVSSFKSGYGWQRPEGMCESAGESRRMKNPKSAMISYNNGFRPISFLIEVMDEKQE